MNHNNPNSIPDIETIHQVTLRIDPFIHRTPVLTCKSLDQMIHAELFFKCENFQKVGAFKFRGATNAVLSLSDEEANRGVATHSSGNHAQALALAAKIRGIKAYIVMPKNSSAVKIKAVEGYGGNIILCEPTLQAREDTLDRVVKETDATFIHPYNDYRIIAGQATCAQELLEEVKNLDLVIAPVGGGGLLSGTALAVNYLSPETIVVAAEPEGADDAYRSFTENRLIPQTNPQTIADGLRTSLGDKTYPIIRKYVNRIVTVSEDAIVSSMRIIWERMKIIIEPSAAVPFAALLENKIDIAGKRVGIILSGGNVDLDKLPWTK
ncbi:MAG TPA: pyridoxal-phosphate dependent enzyme [candidate division Zixibacteria bacterium]